MRILALLLLAASCSTETIPNVPDSGPVNQCQAGLPFNLDGRVGVLGSLAVHITASGIVNAETTAELLILLDLDQTGQNINAQALICDLQIPTIPVISTQEPIRFVVDPALVESLGTLTVATSLDGTSTCANLTSERVTFVLGAKVAPSSPLPKADANGDFVHCVPEPCETALTTDCACDQENDLNPGATLDAQHVPVIPLTKIYATIRASFALAGKVITSDRVEGLVDATLEQGILGCIKGDTPCSVGAQSDLATIIAFNPTITKSTVEPSTFLGVRVPATTTCAQLRAMRDTLFH
jgi:hypothetical protein